MRDAERDAPALGGVAPALDRDGHELGRPFAVADDRLGQLRRDRGERGAQRCEPPVVGALDRRQRRPAGRGDHEAVVGRRVAVDGRAVERHVGDLPRQRREHGGGDRAHRSR